jgi:pyridoxal phosphate enzyme (YggS family)
MNFDKSSYKEIRSLVEKKYPLAKLMVVSKNRPASIIREAIQEGALLFGENKVQEAEKKFDELRKDFNDIELHLIGPLQTNKVKQAMKIFDVIQSVDREKLVKEISKNHSELLRTQKFYLQINIGKEDQKSGVLPEQTKTLYDYAVERGLNIVGFMCIPPNDKEPDTYFHQMIELKNSINPNLLLSMGMSGDYQSALKYQTNCIRIGSLFFNDQ